ncbi:hypothetical protein SDC9_176723 [bioreactor metagenome]|uniref:Uncharacterized protein n=1 Tax=bioreactor metagenome TaxID=1076179 RepID=A0A645GQT9_9ZZZZ
MIVAVHKVNLESLHAHRGIVAAHLLHIAVEGVVTGPEDDAHAAITSVGDQPGDIDLRDYLLQVSL